MRQGDVVPHHLGQLLWNLTEEMHVTLFEKHNGRHPAEISYLIPRRGDDDVRCR